MNAVFFMTHTLHHESKEVQLRHNISSETTDLNLFFHSSLKPWNMPTVLLSFRKWPPWRCCLNQLVGPHSPQLILFIWHSQPPNPPLHSGWTEHCWLCSNLVPGRNPWQRTVAGSCRFALYNIRRIQSFLAKDATQLLVQVQSSPAWTTATPSWLDSQPLQRNCSSISRTLQHASFSIYPNSPMWPPPPWPPLAAVVLAFKAVNGTAPVYLQTLPKKKK